MTSCEVIETLINVTTYMLRLAVLCRPRSGSKTGKPIFTFLEEFQEYIDSRVTMSGRLVVVGDFNFHYERPDLADTKKLHDLLYSLDLEQHVHEPTHIRGHCLDLVISRSDELTLKSTLHHSLTTVLSLYRSQENMENRPRR